MAQPRHALPAHPRSTLSGHREPLGAKADPPAHASGRCGKTRSTSPSPEPDAASRRVADQRSRQQGPRRRQAREQGRAARPIQWLEQLTSAQPLDRPCSTRVLGITLAAAVIAFAASHSATEILSRRCRPDIKHKEMRPDLRLGLRPVIRQDHSHSRRIRPGVGDRISALAEAALDHQIQTITALTSCRHSE